jgi:hypothetical protein
VWGTNRLGLGQREGQIAASGGASSSGGGPAIGGVRARTAAALGRSLPGPRALRPSRVRLAAGHGKASHPDMFLAWSSRHFVFQVDPVGPAIPPDERILHAERGPTAGMRRPHGTETKLSNGRNLRRTNDYSTPDAYSAWWS